MRFAGIFGVVVALMAGGAFARDAAEFGFSPAASGKENQLALQQAFDEGGQVVISRPGRYRMAGTAFIGSHTRLDCAPGVVLVKTDEGRKFSHVIANKGARTKTWDTDIVVRGLEIAVNGMDACDWSIVYGLRGQLAFFYVKDLRIERFRCPDLGRAQYCIHVCTFEDVVVDDVNIAGGKDGVHFGRGRRFTVRNGVFRTGDDAVALNAHDYSSGNPELGWIEDGVVENCHDLPNPAYRQPGYFCRVLAGAWIDWKVGMEVQISDTVVANGRLYRVMNLPPDGKKFISKTCPSHTTGIVKLDDIPWGVVQNDVTYNCGVRNVVFRDIFLHVPRTTFSVHYDNDRYSRSYYPGAAAPVQEGLVFDNVQVLFNAPKYAFLSVATPIDSLAIVNCTLRDGGLSFITNKAMADYGPTKIQMLGCRFYAKGTWPLVRNAIASKRVDLVTTGSMTYDPGLKVALPTTGTFNVVSDLPGLSNEGR